MLLKIVFCCQIQAQTWGSNNRMNFCLKNVWKKSPTGRLIMSLSIRCTFLWAIYYCLLLEVRTDKCGFVTLCTSVNLSGVKVWRPRSMADEDTLVKQVAYRNRDQTKQGRQHTTIISALKRRRQEQLMFQASLGYTVGLCLKKRKKKQR